MADFNIQLHGPSTSTGSPSNDNLYPVTKAGIVLEVPTGSGTTDLASWVTNINSSLSSKLDKITSGIGIYIHNGFQQQSLPFSTTPSAHAIARYSSSSCLQTSIPSNDNDCANKEYVDDNKVKKEFIYSSTDTTVVPSSDITSYDHFEFATGYGNFLAFLKSDGNIAGGTILIHGGQPYFVYGSANSSLSTINGFWTTMGSPGTSFTLSITAIYGIKY